MELVSGETLEEPVLRDGPLPPALTPKSEHRSRRARVATQAQGIVLRPRRHPHALSSGGEQERPYYYRRFLLSQELVRAPDRPDVQGRKCRGVAFTAARVDAEKTVASEPQNEATLLLLAMIDAALGRKDDAVSEARRGCAMTPQDSERNTGPANRCCLAAAYTWTDQPDLALQELDKLASGPAGANLLYQVTFGDFRLNPVWDPLRDDPRFAKLVERLAPANH